MQIIQKLCGFALRQVVGDAGTVVVSMLEERYADHGGRVVAALQTANERAWRTLEMALADESWWGRFRTLLAPRDEQLFQAQVKMLLNTGLMAKSLPQDRPGCLAELRAARRAALIPGRMPPTHELAQQARQFQRYAAPQQLVRDDLEAVQDLHGELHRQGFPRLADFVALRPTQGPPLLVIAVRFFFRREIESDPKLAAGMSFQQLDHLTDAQQQGLDALHQALTDHGARLDELFSSMLEVVTDTRDDVQAMRAELQKLHRNTELSAVRADAAAAKAELAKQSQQIEEIYQAVLLMMNRASQPTTPSTPNASATVATEWQQVQQLVARCQALPKADQRRMPALFRTVGKLRAATRLDLAASPATIESPEVTHIPIRPPEPTELPSPPRTGPSQRRVSGAVISDIFTAAPASVDDRTDPKPARHEASKAAGAKKRLISSLFEQAPNGEECDRT